MIFNLNLIQEYGEQVLRDNERSKNGIGFCAELSVEVAAACGQIEEEDKESFKHEILKWALSHPRVLPAPPWLVARMKAIEATPPPTRDQVQRQFCSGQHYVALAKDFQRTGLNDKDAWDEACRILTGDGPKLEYICDKKRHLVCIPYTIPFLHRMARDLVIRRRWFHKSHYDIPVKRLDEIMSKCRLVSSKDLVRIVKGEII